MSVFHVHKSSPSISTTSTAGSLLPAALLSSLFAVACASQQAPELANVTRMMAAPPREPGCALQFVQASILDLSPMGKYDVLGYVTVRQLAVADPFAEENRRIVRPRACELGGQAVSIMMSSASMGLVSDASATVYAVLREKSSAPLPPQSF